MKSILPIVAILLLSACMGGGGGTAVSTAPPLPPTEPVSSGFGTMLNQARSDHGAGALNQNALLTQAAQLHSNDQYMMGGLPTHTGSDGSDLGDRLDRVGYDYTWAGENVARGQQSEQTVFDDWMDSTGHRRNNLDPLFEDYGIAKAGSGHHLYWTLVFGRTSPLPSGTF